MKYKRKVDGTIWFGRWWATFRDASRIVGIAELTLRARYRRGDRGLALIEPISGSKHKIRDSDYRAKVRLVVKAYGKTPSELAREAGITLETIRYRIKHLSRLEIVSVRGLALITGGLTPKQQEDRLVRLQAQARIREREMEAKEKEYEDKSIQDYNKKVAAIRAEAERKAALEAEAKARFDAEMAQINWDEWR